MLKQKTKKEDEDVDIPCEKSSFSSDDEDHADK